MISLIVPTIEGREHWLERTLHAYHDTTPDYELIVLRDRATAGIAWNEGWSQAKGDYLHFTADDIEPQAGWWQEGIKWIERGILPAPRVLNTDGTLQSCGDDCSEQETGTPTQVARIPFCSREQAECIFPIIENHYCGDYYFTWKGRQCGWPSLVVRDFVFTHHLVNVGRLNTLDADWAAFQRAKRSIRVEK